MNKKKIFNDPIYGLVDFPHSILYDIIDHRYFQRLRRISQMGFTQLVYPGATNTRFHHALGSLYLMTRSIRTLRSKGVEITEAESEAVSIAILLHDMGHGPFSHALERMILNVSHESVSLMFMHELNEVYDGRLDLAIAIFQDRYKKHFLHQLVSSQLDMDRMDYLIRDTYYTGVAEGVIGYDRLIKMLNVSDDKLVIEEKGIHSIEKFLISRKLMYWQVYLHKTSLAAEKMLQTVFQRVNILLSQGAEVEMTASLRKLLRNDLDLTTAKDTKQLLEEFARCDDHDVMYLLKSNTEHKDFILSYISECILNRRLFKVLASEKSFSQAVLDEQVNNVSSALGIPEYEASELVLEAAQENKMYDTDNDEILILCKSGEVVPLSAMSKLYFKYDIERKHYLYIPGIGGNE